MYQCLTAFKDRHSPESHGTSTAATLSFLVKQPALCVMDTQAAPQVLSCPLRLREVNQENVAEAHYFGAGDLAGLSLRHPHVPLNWYKLRMQLPFEQRSRVQVPSNQNNEINRGH